MFSRSEVIVRTN